MIQFLNNLKINPKMTTVWFSRKNGLPVRLGKLLSNQLRQPGLLLQSVNMISVAGTLEADVLLQTPDVERTRVLFSSAKDDAGVPWDARTVRWQDGLPGVLPKGPSAKDFELFPLTASLAISLSNPTALLEIDIGSNEMTDECTTELAELIFRASSLFNLEMANCHITPAGVAKIVDVIAGHPSMKFVRLSTRRDQGRSVAGPVPPNSVRRHS